MMIKFLSVVLATAMLSGSIMTYADDIHDTDSADGIIEFFDDGNMIDNAEAERLYIEKLFGIDAAIPYANHDSELLTGAAKEIYEQIKVYTREIVEGKRIRTDNLLIQCSENITDESLKTAMDTLWRDSPELLYWREPFVWLGLSYLQEPMALLQTYGKSMNLSINVASDYSLSGKFGTFEVDPVKINAAMEAFKNAKTIAEKYHDLSDYNKIRSYAYEISELTKRSFGGAGVTCSELVNVFDGNDSTGISLGGHARAFQYLCNLSGIDCYTVSDSDDYLTGKIWNIVVLDGTSYHVDVFAASCMADSNFKKGYYFYILQGATKCDGKTVNFNFDIPWCGTDAEEFYTYSEWTLKRYPQNILRVSTVDYEPPKTGTIKVNIKTPENGTPDISGLKVNINGKGANTSVVLTNNVLDVSGFADGSYTFIFSASNCAPRAYDIKVTGGSANGISTATLHLYGDIDGNGKVNTLDVAKANAHAKNKILLSGYDLTVSDIDGNGKVNTLDVAKINAHAKNIIKIW